MLLKSKAESTSKGYRKEIIGFLNGVICSILGRCLLSLSLSKFTISVKFTKVQSSCLTPLLSGFILSFRVTTTIHPIVQFFIICWKRLSFGSQLLLRRHLCLPMLLEVYFDKYAGPSANLKDLRLVCVCSLDFAGIFFLSWMLEGVCFWGEEWHLPGGNYVYVKRLSDNYCPVALLERYILMEDINLSSSVALFKSTNEYKLYGGKLSHSGCREIFEDCLKELGLDHKMYGLHSLWSGGATSAVSYNPNLSERLLKLHGRWKSDTARDMYVWEDVFKRLQISSRHHS